MIGINEWTKHTSVVQVDVSDEAACKLFVTG